MRSYSCLFLLLCAPLPAFSATPEPQVIRGAAHSETVFPISIDVDLRTLPKATPWKPGDPIKEVPRRSTQAVKPLPAPAPKMDPLLKVQAQASLAGGPSIRAFTATRLNYSGQGYTGVNPPDTVGDVGPYHYIQAINGAAGTVYTVYNKTNGAVIAGPFTLDALSSGGACGTGGGDPIVLYDELAGRWLLSEFPASGNNLCVYISKTSDPVSGGWYNYSFALTEFPDYPKYGVWHDAYYVGANESSPALYALDRVNMLAGNPATFQRFTTTALGAFSFQMITPADLDGANGPPAGTPGIFMRHRDDEAHNASPNPTNDYLDLYSFSVDWSTPANSTLTGPISIPVAEFDSDLCGYTSYQCIQQQGSTTTLDPIREVVMNRLAYRNFGSYQVLVGCFVTDATGADRAGIRWFELRKTGAGAWTLYQQGTYSPDSNSRWLGSIAMDGAGNIALGYNICSSTMYPGLRYVGRLASDPLGTLPQGETTIVSGSAANGSNRYGDYAAMSVDPVDGCMFWFTGEYNASSTWSTRIASFSFDTCACVPPSAPGGVSAAADVTNEIKLAWSAASGAASYNVYRAAGACPGSSYAYLANVTTTSFTNRGLSAGSTYSYVVRSFVTSNACESTNSACVQATATGACNAPPTFAGLSSVSNLQSATCILRLQWSPATAGCGTVFVYNVYRSTNATFVPSVTNLIASCIGTTRYSDASALSGRTNFYLVRAEDPSLAGTGPCAGGTEDTNLVFGSGAPPGPIATYFSDAMENGTAQWSEGYVTTNAGSAWALAATDYHSASTSYFCAALNNIKDRAVRTASPVALPAGSAPILEFWHRVDQESTFDGCALEYSTNNVLWTDILAANGSLPANANRFLAGGYNATISSSYFNPIGGRSAWSGTIGGFGAFSRVAVNLADFAGRSVYLRWRLACDNGVAATGWWIDDVVVSMATSCQAGGYETWRSNFVWTTGTGQPTEDANGDGINNLESYFYGLNPTAAVASASFTPRPKLSAVSNGLEFGFTPNTNAYMSSGYHIEQATNLFPATWNLVLPTPSPGSNGQVRLPLGYSNTNQFLRIRIVP